MKLTIECTEEQAQMLISCLEESFRFRLKQEHLFLDRILLERYEDIGSERFGEVLDQAENACVALMGAVYGPDYIDTPKEATEISDMWSVLRHEIYMATTDNPDPWVTASRKPIQISDMPLIKCEVEV